MFEKVTEMLAKYLKADPATITADTDIKNDLKADSLLVVEMLSALEDEMNITIPDDMVEKLTRVGTLVEYLEKAAQ